MAKWIEHNCNPARGEWSSDGDWVDEVPRPETVKLGTKSFRVHYVEFASTILQIDTELNDIVCIWERV